MIQIKVHAFKKINEISQKIEWVLVTFNPKLLGNFVDELMAESRETYLQSWFNFSPVINPVIKKDPQLTKNLQNTYFFTFKSFYKTSSFL